MPHQQLQSTREPVDVFLLEVPSSSLALRWGMSNFSKRRLGWSQDYGLTKYWEKQNSFRIIPRAGKWAMRRTWTSGDSSVSFWYPRLGTTKQPARTEYSKRMENKRQSTAFSGSAFLPWTAASKNWSRLRVGPQAPQMWDQQVDQLHEMEPLGTREVPRISAKRPSFFH